MQKKRFCLNKNFFTKCNPFNQKHKIMLYYMQFLERGQNMTIEGYFDGTVVRSLEPLHLKPQQKVFIHIPNSDFSDAKKERIESKLEAFHSVFGMLSEKEADAVDESIKSGVRLRDAEL